MSSDHPTIFALSSGRPPAAIAVVRISGPRAGAALEALGVKIPAPRQAGLARVRDPASGEMIDEALVLWFPGPNSETGEDTAELQLHGGRAVIAATLDALGRIDGLRMAEPGEFTRRAFENGKLDLTAVEGLADLVMAETEGQRRQAFRQMKGALGARAEAWREKLIRALALVEARIDFSDEADVPEDLLTPAQAIARDLEGEIAAALADGGRGERLREGLVVAIAGPPNAGKSTLLNRLARREAAIVSPFAGTTRDVIEVHLDLGGWPVTLLDTAGIRETDDPVEMEGVRRAHDRAAAADLVLWVVDASEDDSSVFPGREQSERARNPEPPAVAPGFRAPGSGRPRDEQSNRLSQPAHVSPAAQLRPVQSSPVAKPQLGQPVPSALSRPGPAAWLVRNKIDLVDQRDTRNEQKIQYIERNVPGLTPTSPLKGMVNKQLPQRNESFVSFDVLEFNLSAATGDGFDALLSQLARHAEAFLGGAEAALVTRERHRRMLEDTLAALRRAVAEPIAGREDLLAEELRLAARALGRLTGRVDVEDVLDVIFRDFCIGK